MTASAKDCSFNQSVPCGTVNAMGKTDYFVAAMVSLALHANKSTLDSIVASFLHTR